MTKNFKNILNRYVCLSSFILLPIWFVTSLLVNIVFESKKLALLTLVIGLINWFFVMVHFEICTSSIDNENKIGDILFSIYVTILLILSTYIVLVCKTDMCGFKSHVRLFGPLAQLVRVPCS